MTRRPGGQCPGSGPSGGHDRELLAACATGIVTVEGIGCWTHPGSFRTYDDAREARNQRLGDAERRWRDEERRRFRHYKDPSPSSTAPSSRP